MKKYTIHIPSNELLTTKMSAPIATDPTSKEYLILEGSNNMTVSDGYHTMDDLYNHRVRLFITLCSAFADLKKGLDPEHNPMTVAWMPPIWASTLHSDGSSFGDWFILGMYKEKGKQITYHLPARYWHEVCDFAEILERAPEWDGHTPDDVIKRLESL